MKSLIQSLALTAVVLAAAAGSTVPTVKQQRQIQPVLQDGPGLPLCDPTKQGCTGSGN